MLMHFLSYRTVQIFCVLALYLICAPFLSMREHQYLYTISIFIKDCLMWMIPATIFFFIAHTLRLFGRKAHIFIIMIVLFEAFSNFSSVWYSFGCGHLVCRLLPPVHIDAFQINFSALWRIPWLRPGWWSPTQGMVFGVCMGCFSALYPNAIFFQWIEKGKNMMDKILTKGFARLIPIFILGFFAQLYATQALSYMVLHYAPLIFFLCVFLMIYLFVLLFIGSGAVLLKTVQNAKALLPAGGIALTTGCSLSTMPWTIAGAMKIMKTPELAKAIIPTTTNIQQIGDCIVNTFLCFLIYRQFYGQAPDVMMWLSFSIVFTLARFATAAVLGGAIFIMLPIYEKYLFFQPEMIALIVAFNVILDSIVTATNVIANAALCRIFEIVWTGVSKALVVFPFRKSRV